jgi:Squalene-hopene cyclase N-terminal domain/Prenyltransferase and squalene oxidase repeat
MAAMAVRAARRAGLPVDERAAKEQLRVMSAQAANSQVRILQGMERSSEVDLGLAQGLRESEYPADAITDSLVTRIATTQRSDGSWERGPALSRAPSGESDIGRTVQAVRVLQTYCFPAAGVAFQGRIANTRRWLLEQKPRTTDESAMLLLGLTWTSADWQKIRRIAEALISQQRPDGGWAGNPNLTSDAFATGEALYALRESGFAAAGSRAHQRGVQYLLTTQYPDGSWYVRSRAVKLQPYFQSGFPFDHDQWISAAATAWASTALAAEIESRRK